MKHRTLKLVALAIITLMVTLAVPHVQLWGVTVGVAAARADHVLIVQSVSSSTGNPARLEVTLSDNIFSKRVVGEDEVRIKSEIKSSQAFTIRSNKILFKNPGGTTESKSGDTNEVLYQESGSFSPGKWQFWVEVILTDGTFLRYPSDTTKNFEFSVVSLTSSKPVRQPTDLCQNYVSDYGPSQCAPVPRLGGYFEAGYCPGVPSPSTQCFTPSPSITDCSSCLNDPAPAGSGTAWCYTNTISNGYCAYKASGAPSCVGTAIRDVAKCGSGAALPPIPSPATTPSAIAESSCQKCNLDCKVELGYTDAECNQLCGGVCGSGETQCQKCSLDCKVELGYTDAECKQLCGNVCGGPPTSCDSCMQPLMTAGLTNAEALTMCALYCPSGETGSGAGSGAVLSSCSVCSTVNKFWCTSKANPAETVGHCEQSAYSCATTEQALFMETCPGYGTPSAVVGTACSSGSYTCLPGSGAYSYYFCYRGAWQPVNTGLTQTACQERCQSEAASGGTCLIPSSGSGTGTGSGSGGLSLCDRCLSAGDNWCEASYSYTSGRGQSWCYPKTQRILDSQMSCQQQRGGTLISPGDVCPQPASCQEQCVQLVYSGGLSSYIPGMASSGYNPYGGAGVSSIPIGQCSLTQGQLNGIGGIGSIGSISGTQVLNARPLTGRGETVGCTGLEYCTCYIINPVGVTGSITGIGGTANYGTATIPGTTRLPAWEDPGAKQNVPSATPNQPNCDSPSDASIAADVKPKLVQGGDIVTVSGDVGKLTNTCVGYERTCRAIRQVAYKRDGGFFKDSYKLQSCPSDMPVVLHKECRGEEGKDECSDWRVGRILGISAIVAAVIGCTIASAGAGTGPCTKALAQIGLATAHTGNVAVAGGAVTTTTYSINWAAIAALAASSATSVATGRPVCTPVRSGGTVSTVCVPTSGQNPYQQLQQSTDEKPSFSVCSKEYKTTITANPLCNQGGNVISWRDAAYSCPTQSCQAFAGKDVDVTIYSPQGEVAHQERTRTGSDGKFSITFIAPQTVGDYSVAVVVPGIRTTTAGSGSSSSSSSGSGTGSGTGSGDGDPNRNPDPNIESIEPPVAPLSGALTARTSFVITDEAPVRPLLP